MPGAAAAGQSDAELRQRLFLKGCQLFSGRRASNKSDELSANFWRSLAAVLIGNALYFACSGFLPPPARHNTAGIDLGLAVDFWFCLVVLGLLKLRDQHKKTLRPAALM